MSIGAIAGISGVSAQLGTQSATSVAQSGAGGGASQLTWMQRLVRSMVPNILRIRPWRNWRVAKTSISMEP